jgi:hypothetical protein
LFDEQIDPPKRPALASIKTVSRLEARRHLLAGRRRKKRIEDAQRGEARDGVSIEVKNEVRNEVMQLLQKENENSREGQPRGDAQIARQERRLKAVEIEYLIREWARQQEGITLKDGRVEVNLAGDEPFSHSEEEVRSIARSLGVSLPGDKQFQAGRRLSADFFNPPWIQNHSPYASPLLDVLPPSPVSNQLKASYTLTTTMHLVFPQHTNSQSIIFGGNTMSWSEDVALMACRKISVSNSKHGQSWKTVAMDGLEFSVPVKVGE